jgi:hypothetical protein
MEETITCKTCKCEYNQQNYISILKNCLKCREKTKEVGIKRKEKNKRINKIKEQTQENQNYNLLKYVNNNGPYNLINEYTEFLRLNGALTYTQTDRVSVNSNLIIINDFVKYLQKNKYV